MSSSTASTSEADVAWEMTYARSEPGGSSAVRAAVSSTSTSSLARPNSASFSKEPRFSSGRPVLSSLESHSTFLSSGHSAYPLVPARLAIASTAFMWRVDSWRRSRGARFRPKARTCLIRSTRLPSARSSKPEATSDSCMTVSTEANSSTSSSGAAETLPPPRTKDGSVAITPILFCCFSAHLTVLRSRSISWSMTALYGSAEPLSPASAASSEVHLRTLKSNRNLPNALR
mmetsp:Transcript_100650/g.262378  ORF Transcript_100650/g.262378 Transcript_100650/m.262378 type:complete len:231 (+) Transcript_100650:501-1193(+)